MKYAKKIEVKNKNFNKKKFKENVNNLINF